MICSRFSDHPFHGLTLLDKYELLNELKRNTLLSSRQINSRYVATGAPSHIDQVIAFKGVFDLCTDINVTLDRPNEILCNNIFEAINEKEVKAEGSVNFTILAQSLNKLKNGLFCRTNSFRDFDSNTPTYKIQSLSEVEGNVRLTGPFSFQCKGSSRYTPLSCL